MTPEEAKERARTYFIDQNFNCAETVLQVLQEYFNLPGGVNYAPATAFGAGIARCQDVCGAVTGAALAESLRANAVHPERTKARAEAYHRANSLYNSFTARFGATDCRCLVGHDFGDADAHQRFVDSKGRESVCLGLVYFAIEQSITI